MKVQNTLIQILMVLGGLLAVVVGLMILGWINWNLFISADAVFIRTMGTDFLSRLFWIPMGYASALIMIWTGHRWMRQQTSS
jgi:hypothetical protein